MTAVGTGLIVALGSVIGQAIVNPTEFRALVIVFAIFNALFASVAFAVGRMAFRYYTDTKARLP